jgi:hypothetical protein
MKNGQQQTVHCVRSHNLYYFYSVIILLTAVSSGCSYWGSGLPGLPAAAAAVQLAAAAGEDSF